MEHQNIKHVTTIVDSATFMIFSNNQFYALIINSVISKNCIIAISQLSPCIKLFQRLPTMTLFIIVMKLN